MPKIETPMTRRYWKRVGGTLLEEFLVVPRTQGVGRRLIDAVIVLDGDNRISAKGEIVSISGHDLVVVQTKAYRLGMYLLGQALFSRELIEKFFAPRSVRTVALCAVDDAVLRPIAERFGIEVVVDRPASIPPAMPPGPAPDAPSRSARHRGLPQRRDTLADLEAGTCHQRGLSLVSVRSCELQLRPSRN
jgi:hypothetical protein